MLYHVPRPNILSFCSCAGQLVLAASRRRTQFTAVPQRSSTASTLGVEQRWVCPYYAVIQLSYVVLYSWVSYGFMSVFMLLFGSQAGHNMIFLESAWFSLFMHTVFWLLGVVFVAMIEVGFVGFVCCSLVFYCSVSLLSRRKKLSILFLIVMGVFQSDVLFLFQSWFSSEHRGKLCGHGVPYRYCTVPLKQHQSL